MWGFLLKVTVDEIKVFRRRSPNSQISKDHLNYSEEKGLPAGNCRQGDQTTDDCNVTSKK